MNENIRINKEEYDKNLKNGKEALKKKLKEIIVSRISDTEMVLKTIGGDKMKINTDCDVDEYGVKVGDFAFSRGRLLLWVGISKKGYTAKVDDAMWGLHEGDDGIAHFGGNRAEDFNEEIRCFVLNV